MTAPILAATGIHRSVRLPGGHTLDILRGADLELGRGDSVSIEGRSGSGKTTLLALLGLLTPVTIGKLWIAGHRATGVSDAHRARLRNQHVGFVFQSYSLVRHLSARQNVELPMRYGARCPDHRQRARDLLGLVGLAERQRSRPRQLSGGEQQRVAIARALARGPGLILADEPTGALDVQTATAVLDALVRATTDRGAALVIVTHDPAVAARTRRRLTLEDGRLNESVGAR